MVGVCGMKYFVAPMLITTFFTQTLIALESPSIESSISSNAPFIIARSGDYRIDALISASIPEFEALGFSVTFRDAEVDGGERSRPNLVVLPLQSEADLGIIRDGTIGCEIANCLSIVFRRNTWGRDYPKLISTSEDIEAMAHANGFGMFAIEFASNSWNANANIRRVEISRLFNKSSTHKDDYYTCSFYNKVPHKFRVLLTEHCLSAVLNALRRGGGLETSSDPEEKL